MDLSQLNRSVGSLRPIRLDTVPRGTYIHGYVARIGLTLMLSGAQLDQLFCAIKLGWGCKCECT